MTMRTKPEWPLPEQKTIVWDFSGQRATAYYWSYDSVACSAGRLDRDSRK